MISTDTAKTTLEHREAFIQDLAGLGWYYHYTSYADTHYVAHVLSDPNDWDDPMYSMVVAKNAQEAAALTTTEDPRFFYHVTRDEAKRILGEAWEEAA